MANLEMILSRDAYLLGVELSIFWSVAALYGGSLILYVFHLLTRGAPLGRAALTLHWAAVLFNLVLFLFRTFETGRAPCYSPYETLSIFALSASLSYLYVSRRSKGVYLPGLLVSGVSAIACFKALLVFTPLPPPVSPISGGTLFELHAILVFVSFGLFTAGAAIEITAIFLRTLLKGGPSPAYGLEPAGVASFRKRGGALSTFALPLLAFAIVSGGAWSASTHGRFWNWTGAEAWPLVILIAFILHQHSRGIERTRGNGATVFSIAGAALIISVIYSNLITGFSRVSADIIMLTGIMP
jgi:ABC-type transport system involved in cytochrome c biogenesis permease subunit